MKVFINKKELECKEDACLSDVLDSYSGKRIAVAVDKKIVPKDKWSGVQLAAGTDIIIIKAVQGG